VQHPAQLTGWIKHSSSVRELQQLHNAHSSQFNTIHLSAVLVKLAKLDESVAVSTSSSSSTSSSMQEVQQFALQLADELLQQLDECSDARQAANASWALATLQCSVPTGLLQSAAQQLSSNGGQLLTSSQPQELAMLAWGLAKLQHDLNCVVWPQLVAAAQQQLAGFKPQELTMLMWALASLQQRQQQRWRSGAPAEAGASKGSSSSSYTAQWLAESAEQQQQGERRAAQALRTRLQYSASTSSSSSSSRPASAGSSSRPGSAAGRQQDSLQQRLQQFWPAVCDTISLQLQRGAQRYKAQELSSLLWSCAVLNCRDAQLLQQLANQLQQQLLQGRCNSQDVSNSLWALGKLQLQHPLLLAAAADTAGSWMKQCSNSELSLVLYGCAATSREGAGSQATAQLWLLCTDEVQQRLLIAADGWGLAECTTLLQAVASVLQSPARVRSRQRQQQAQQRQQLQRQAQQNNSSSSSAASAAPPPQQQQQQPVMQEQSLQHAGTTAAPHGQSSNGSGSTSTSSSMCSMSSVTGSWDADDVGMADAARELAAAVDAHLSRSQLISPSSSSIRLYLPCILSSFAVAQLQPSQQLRHALLTTASRITAGLNRQQLCMTAWAAAKLAPQPGAAADEETWQLMDLLESAALSKLPAMQPQQLSVLAWAHARLWNLGDSLLLHELARSAARSLPRFGPQALSNLAWAFARARHYDGAFTAALSRRARPLLRQFSAAELSNLAWGLLTLRCRQSVLLTALGKYTTQHCSCSSWDAKACTKIAYAYASGGMPLHRFRGMFRALGDAVLAKPGGLAGLNVHELSQLAQAFAVARVRHKALVGHIASAAMQRLPSMALVDVVQLVWALACLNHRHDQLLAAVSARVAAEMGSQQQQHPHDDSSCEALADSSSSFVGPASQLDGAAAGWDGSSSISMFQGKLRPQYLPKLAWAYKTLQHEDAGWYMAAAVLAAELTGDDGTGSSSSSDDGSSSGYYGHSNGSSFAGSSSSRVGSSSSSSGVGSSSSWPGRGPRAAPAGVDLLRVPQNGNSRHASNSHGTSTPGCSSSSSKGGSSIPTLLQRPVYQQPDVNGAAAVQQQQ
jgi:hypothetical protein